ncbi:MAG: biopolymer transporter ExbD [Pyrinomonadaceae bacterium]|nr:biopolymer transporter ExbD [Pyrinomonadaceae bacterium]
MKANAPMRKASPNINVTPLIDVLLVLLILFMVITPLRPAAFKAQVPQAQQPETEPIAPHPYTLIVTITEDLQLKLNNTEGMGTVNDTGNLSAELTRVFNERIQNGVYRYGLETRIDIKEAERIERTVFIKAPRSIDYGEVVKVIDSVKGAGAHPIGLQLDDLD